mmetsp:Transcript_16359/g.46572  ORF Transcript_16359/g.46572 Transcript_16359/m.46572 type:complete len:180 (-) Transcript_16359:2-541(-)
MSVCVMKVRKRDINKSHLAAPHHVPITRRQTCARTIMRRHCPIHRSTTHTYTERGRERERERDVGLSMCRRVFVHHHTTAGHERPSAHNRKRGGKRGGMPVLYHVKDTHRQTQREIRSLTEGSRMHQPPGSQTHHTPTHLTENRPLPLPLAPPHRDGTSTAHRPRHTMTKTAHQSVCPC